VSRAAHSRVCHAFDLTSAEIFPGAFMSKAIYEVHQSVAVIRLDNPPVNGLGYDLRKGIVEGIDRAQADDKVQAIVIIGSERAFSGGADIREFGTPKALAQPNLPAVIRALEQASKPVIAAVGGVCMGGGLELALGAHYRIAKAGAQIALPEVKLGLLPGAGGTQRLPRVIGVERALNFIVSGTTAPAESFKDTALFDAWAEGELLSEAIAYARKLVADQAPLKRVRDIRIDYPQAEPYFQFARNNVKAASGPYPAPLACVEAVASSVSKPFDEGLAHERELFTRLLQTPESAALRHVFQAERAAGRVNGVADDTPARTIRKVGVIGAGTMGGGIAMTLANAGIPVVLLEAKQEALDKGLATIRRNYEGSLKKGKLTPAQLEQRLGLIAPTLDYDAFADVDLVIEAVFESMDVKKTVFETLDRVCKPGAILASNTSALDLNQIASFTKRPQDVVGLHFFSPAHVMRLLEVVRGSATAPDVLASCMQLAKKIRKIAVVAGVCDGFIGNRIIARYGQAAHDLLMLGASPQEVDKALEAFGFAMGPFRVGDLSGLDIGHAGRMRRAAAEPHKDFSSVADALVESGQLGQKTGAGWYLYEPGRRDPLPNPRAPELIAQYRAARGLTPRKVTPEEIVERCIYAMVNEGARIVEDGTAQRASDIDIVYLNGYGFPAHRGGPMFYADLQGLPNVLRAIQRIGSQYSADPEFWQPAPLLRKLVAEGKTFNG